MDFDYSPKTKDNHAFNDAVARGDYPMDLIDGLKAKARAVGLWNLFMPSLPEHYEGTRASNLEYAPWQYGNPRTLWHRRAENRMARPDVAR